MSVPFVSIWQAIYTSASSHHMESYMVHVLLNVSENSLPNNANYFWAKETKSSSQHQQTTVTNFVIFHICCYGFRRAMYNCPFSGIGPRASQGQPTSAKHPCSQRACFPNFIRLHRLFSGKPIHCWLAVLLAACMAARTWENFNYYQHGSEMFQELLRQMFVDQTESTTLPSFFSFFLAILSRALSPHVGGGKNCCIWLYLSGNQQHGPSCATGSSSMDGWLM